MGNGIRKGSSSSRRKSRTIVNSLVATTTIENNNYICPTRLEYMNNQLNNKQKHVTSDAEEE